MRFGLVVVLAVTGCMLALPFWFAWLSSNPLRWAPVERVLGEDFRRAVRRSRPNRTRADFIQRGAADPADPNG